MAKFSPEMRMALKMAAGYGMRVPQLAAIAGVPVDVFEKRLSRDRLLRRALDEGRALAELEVSKTLFEKATSGDINAIKWYEQTRTGRSSKEEVHQHNLNLDFSAAVAKFEALNAKMRLSEPTKAEIFLTGGELANNLLPESSGTISVKAETIND